MALNFHQFYRLSDIVFAEHFEGVPQRVDWTSLEWTDILTQLHYMMVFLYSDEARSIFIAQQLRGPIRDIEAIVSG